MRTPPVFTVVGADDVFKVARERGGRPIGRTLRGIPAVETFQFMKCANQVTLEGEGHWLQRGACQESQERSEGEVINQDRQEQHPYIPRKTVLLGAVGPKAQIPL
ncbi:polycystin 1L2 [Sarotherodon galilaeus]